jgi:hypothetical protein
MTINIKKLYFFLFAIILLVQLYVESYRIIIFSQIIILTGVLLIEKKVSTHFLKLIVPLFIVALIPVIPVFFNNYKLNYILKDIFLILKPIVGICLGYLIFKRINNLSDFVKIIVYVGLLSAIIHFIILFVTGGLVNGSVSQIREYGKDNFLELFALFFLGFYKKFFSDDFFPKKNRFRIVFLILLISSTLYLSRTMLILSVLLLLGIYGYLKVTPKAIKIFLVIIASFFVLYVYLFNTKIDRNEKGLMGFLYKVKMAPAEIFDSKIDINNHKELWDHWRAYEANRALELMKNNPSSFIIGNGYGSLVNLRFKAPLASDNKGLQYISETHNGYIFILYKLGIIGLSLILMFFIFLYKKIYISKNFVNTMLSTIAICYFFTTLTITGIYNKRDIIIFVLGGLLYFTSNSKNTLTNEY